MQSYLALSYLEVIQGGKDFFHMLKHGWSWEDQINEGAWDLVFNV